MEVFGICLSIPVTLTGSVVFCFCATRILRRLPGLRRPIVITSAACPSLAATELTASLVAGPVRLHNATGNAYRAHAAR
jgi:hypothetical protein